MNEERVFSMNTARICIDGRRGTVSGRVYSKLRPAPIIFSGLGEMLLEVNRMFDECGYPQAFQELRSFQDQTERAGPWKFPQPQLGDEEMEQHRGRYCTFDIVVQSRRQAGWQGILMKPDRTLVARFSSELELLGAMCEELENLRLTG